MLCRLFKILQRGAFHIEYAILLAFATVFFGITNMREPIGTIASNEAEHPKINKYAYQEAPVYVHGNNPVTPDPVTPDPEPDPEPETPNIENIINAGYTGNLEKGYYIDNRGVLSEGNQHQGNYFRLDYNESERQALDRNSQYSVSVSNADYKMKDSSGHEWSLSDYKIQFIVAYDYINQVGREYVETVYDYKNICDINSQNFTLQTKNANFLGVPATYFLVFNVCKIDGSSVNQGNEIIAVSYMLQQNLVIEKVQK